MLRAQTVEGPAAVGSRWKRISCSDLKLYPGRGVSETNQWNVVIGDGRARVLEWEHRMNRWGYLITDDADG
jgi:hypothetical protein